MRIEWTDPAVSDLAAIRDYIALDSEDNAIRFIGRLLESVEKISAFPQMGRSVPEAKDAGAPGSPLVCSAPCR